jgi:hypothetical protein
MFCGVAGCLTNSMEHSLYWEANSSSPIERFPAAQFGVHMSPPRIITLLRFENSEFISDQF